MKKPKKPTVSKLKKKAWALCSQYIRLKHADHRGFVTCYTCGKQMYWKQSQAGHGFAGRSKAVLFMEDIIRPQGVGCNVFQNGKLDVFTYKLRKELGDEKFDILYKLAHANAGQWKIWELEEIRDYYKKKVGELCG